VAECRKILPEISATTVHRITSRLIQRGALAYGPEINGSRLVDINIKPHDHFICDGCMGVKDILIPDNLRESIKKQVPGLISGASLTIRGECNSCNK
jgi:Fur family peroxide stress response transcriptional regulator